jgi:hypothetical protein
MAHALAFDSRFGKPRYVGTRVKPVISFSQPDAFFLLLPLASLVIFALFRHRRHWCPHRDPLCRRNRLCIGCYRKLFSNVNIKAQDSPVHPKAHRASSARPAAS